jgi:hypothetical protein
MRWLVWELIKYVMLGVIAWLVILAIPGEQPRWLQFAIVLLVALAMTIVIYRVRVSRGRRGP